MLVVASSRTSDLSDTPRSTPVTRTLVVTGLASSLLATLVISWVRAAADETLAPATFAPSKPPQTKEGDVNVHYVGTVTGITKDSIAIEWPGEKPKWFVASEALAAGQFPLAARPFRPGARPRATRISFRYRLQDVKVGDRVQIHFSQLGGIQICDEIQIDNRPGGLVPPLPDGAERLKTSLGRPTIRYHEMMNALWDLEDKGIPFPEKFGEMRRWPIAPMPREVKLPGPRISQ